MRRQPNLVLPIAHHRKRTKKTQTPVTCPFRVHYLTSQTMLLGSVRHPRIGRETLASAGCKFTVFPFSPIFVSLFYFYVTFSVLLTFVLHGFSYFSFTVYVFIFFFFTHTSRFSSLPTFPRLLIARTVDGLAVKWISRAIRSSRHDVYPCTTSLAPSLYQSRSFCWLFFKWVISVSCHTFWINLFVEAKFLHIPSVVLLSGSILEIGFFSRSQRIAWSYLFCFPLRFRFART